MRKRADAGPTPPLDVRGAIGLGCGCLGLICSRLRCKRRRLQFASLWCGVMGCSWCSRFGEGRWCGQIDRCRTTNCNRTARNREGHAATSSNVRGREQGGRRGGGRSRNREEARKREKIISVAHCVIHQATLGLGLHRCGTTPPDKSAGREKKRRFPHCKQINHLRMSLDLNLRRPHVYGDLVWACLPARRAWAAPPATQAQANCRPPF